MTQVERGWHFAPSSGLLRYGDSREVKPGVTFEVDGPPVLCRHGLHDSILPLDALSYAPGPFVSRTMLGGEVVCGDDKRVATQRTHLWCYDATEVLRRFARLCALDVLHLWDAPVIVVRYLRTGDESIRAAAWDAALDAARAAAREAALADAWAVARVKQSKRLHRMLMEGRP